MEHCLKRVVGLPNENVAIIEGDLWVDGKRLKKNWSMLESLALTVHDSRYVPQKSMAVSRWRPQREQTRWKKKTQGVQGDQYFQNSEKIDQDPLIDWLVYEHVDFHRGHRRTTGRITDNYAYNQALSRRLYRTDDLIFSAQIQCSGNGQLFFQVGDCCLQLDCSQERGTLCESGQRVADFLWDPTDLHASVRVDIAAVDKQFFFVIDGEVIFRCNLESDLVSDSTQNATDSICIAEKNDMFPLALGSQSLRVTLKEILVRRDIYYTPDVRGVLGIRTNNYNLGEDEFFVLGDNSPVSLDSRRDLDAAILHRSDLLGRVWRWR
jgi:signal peptidase I